MKFDFSFVLGLGLELLEAQAATGCILDPMSGERYDVRGALEHNLIDTTQMDAMERAMRAVTGYKDPVTGHTLSLFEVIFDIVCFITVFKSLRYFLKLWFRK